MIFLIIDDREKRRPETHNYAVGILNDSCYFFQDSIIYHMSPTDVYHPKLGDYLGCMRDELAEYGVWLFHLRVRVDVTIRDGVTGDRFR